MSTVKNNSLKKEYVKSKIILKTWEDEFIARNGRIPEKADIKLSPSYVKESYNKYYKIKIKLLATQILGKEEAVNEDSLPKTILSSEENKNSECVEEIHDANQKNNKDPKISASDSIEKIDPKTWGADLNKTKSNLQFKEGKKIIFNQVLSKTIYENTSFKKRNPRKSLVLKNKEVKKSINSSNTSLSSLNDQTTVDKEQHLQNEENQNINSTNKDFLEALQNSTKNESLAINQVGLVQQIISGLKGPLEKQNSQESWIENKLDKLPITLNFCDLNPDSKSNDMKETLNETFDEDIIRSSDNELDENSKLQYKFTRHKRKFDSSSNMFDENVHSDDLHNKKKIKLNHEFSKDSKETICKKMQNKRKQVNDNFVKLNLIKKTYVRGKRKFNFSKYKKEKWKKEKRNITNSIESESKYCNINEIDSLELERRKKLPRELIQFEEEMNSDNLEISKLETQKLLTLSKENNYFSHDDNVTKEPTPGNVTTQNFQPFYDFDNIDSVVDTQAKIFEGLKLFGHSQFLPGQKETIMRILGGQSTILISSTGGGKSLCYQLPAYLYAKRSKCIALVISPLISLMEDQVSSSSFFKAGYLHSDQSPKQYADVLEKAKEGKLYAILISPEMVASGDSVYVFNNVFKQLPPISFACIDEIHCMSHWSHNFRPSYLIISRVLREKLGVKTILGLTATATISTIENITSEVEISKNDGIIKTGFIPDNLYLSISRFQNKDDDLISILKSSKFKDLQSILIYCKRRDECERLAILIRTVFHNESILHAKNKKYKQLSWFAESYHAGMTAARRKLIQKAFMSGNIRIVVATVAFGMGINKPDIRAVIHYNIPKDFENYVQEVGRAGRDGSPAYCHLFLDTKGEDLCQLSSHIHSVSIDRYVIRKLLEKVFKTCDCEKESKRCEGHEIAFSVDDTVSSLDVPQINIQTLLCYLEHHPKNFIKVLSPIFFKCKIKSYKGMNALIDASKICPPLACAYLSMPKSSAKCNVWELDIVKISNELGWRSELIKTRLKNLEWELKSGTSKVKTGISVEFFNLGFRVKSRGDLKPSELDEALDYLMQKVEDQKLKSLNHLDIMFSIFDNFASDRHNEMLDSWDLSKSDKLKQAIRHYFETEELSQNIPLQKFQLEEFDEKVVAADIRSLISIHSDNSFNARSVARIFHGISSPNYPASFWYKNRFWRKHKNKDFNKIFELAKQEILRTKI